MSCNALFGEVVCPIWHQTRIQDSDIYNGTCLAYSLDVNHIGVPGVNAIGSTGYILEGTLSSAALLKVKANTAVTLRTAKNKRFIIDFSLLSSILLHSAILDLSLLICLLSYKTPDCRTAEEPLRWFAFTGKIHHFASRLMVGLPFRHY
jgi:hypothetical protein